MNVRGGVNTCEYSLAAEQGRMLTGKAVNSQWVL